MAGACPMISGNRDGLSVSVFVLLSFMALLIRSTALSRSKGLDKYSKAPPAKADTAESRSEYAVMIIIGI